MRLYHLKTCSLSLLFSDCSKIFTDSEGVISTPNYPGLYYKDLSCVYTIQVGVNHRVRLSFTDFDLPMNKSVDGTCREDYLTVREDFNTYSSYCTEAPKTLYSSNNLVQLIFRSGMSSSRGRGFRVEYKTEPSTCGGVLNAPSGSAERFYNKDCEWIIQVKERNYIRLTFTLLLGTFGGDITYAYISSNSSYKPHLLKT